MTHRQNLALWAATIAAVLFFAIVWQSVRAKDRECTARGGVLARSTFGHVCVQPVPPQQPTHQPAGKHRKESADARAV
jgi:hypothetical protein